MFAIIVNFTFCSEVQVPFQRNTDSLTSSMMTIAYNPLLLLMGLDKDLEEEEEEEYDSKEVGEYYSD